MTQSQTKRTIIIWVWPNQTKGFFLSRVTYLFTIYLQKLLLSQDMPSVPHNVANLEALKYRNDVTVDNRSYVDIAFSPCNNNLKFGTPYAEQFA